MAYYNFHTHNASKDDQEIVIENVFPEDYWSGNFSSDWISVGVHPWYILGDGSDQITQLERIINDDRVKVIGEAGLDKLKGPDMEKQMQVFRKQIELSEQADKPLIIHCVKAYNEIINLRKQLCPRQPWIFHGFSSSQQVLRQVIEAGFYISFGTRLLVEYSKVQIAFREAPLDRCFLETDEAPESVFELYQKAAIIKELEIHEIESRIDDNIKRIFK